MIVVNLTPKRRITMAKRTRRGQKQCPSCQAWLKGTRAKVCPKCGYDFVSKQAPAGPAAAPAPAKASNGAITIEQIKAVVGTVKLVGGTERLNELLGLVKEVGGLKKFKDLVDAITG
jgi:hypothetical protein